MLIFAQILFMDYKKLGSYSAYALLVLAIYLACSISALTFNPIEWHPVIRLAMLYFTFVSLTAKDGKLQ
jgi:hypothetical protein